MFLLLSRNFLTNPVILKCMLWEWVWQDLYNLETEKQRHYFANKCPSSQSCDFSSSYVQMWELDHKEGWALKNWCFPTVVLKKTLESPLNKEIKPVSPRGNQSWILIDAPILWPPDVKSRFIGKYSNTRENWGQEEKGVIEDEMVRWHHWLSGHEFEQTPE